MCGRYTIVKKPEGLARQLEVQLPKFFPRYNLAPSQLAPVVLNEGGVNAAEDYKWGLVPFWAKDEKIGYKMINARSETAREKPAYRRAFKTKRCLVLADGFYEWKRSGKTKLPYRILLRSEEPFAFAGLWESWTHREGERAGEELRTFTILTTDANRLIQSIHDRMPVMLDVEGCRKWIDPQSTAEDLSKLLQPYNPWEMKAYPVGSDVNNPRNSGEDLIEPVGPGIGTGTPAG